MWRQGRRCATAAGGGLGTHCRRDLGGVRELRGCPSLHCGFSLGCDAVTKQAGSNESAGLGFNPLRVQW